MHTHRFPQPMWNASEHTVIFDELLGPQLGKKQCEPGEIVYVPNLTVYNKLTSQGQSRVWTEKAILAEYPKAMHGPDMQSVTVYSKEEEEMALQNGWSLRPIIEEKPSELPPSPFRPPKIAAMSITNGQEGNLDFPRGLAIQVPSENLEPRGPGRPRKSA